MVYVARNSRICELDPAAEVLTEFPALIRVTFECLQRC